LSNVWVFFVNMYYLKLLFPESFFSSKHMYTKYHLVAGLPLARLRRVFFYGKGYGKAVGAGE